MDEATSENRNALSGFAENLASQGLLDHSTALDALQKSAQNKQSYIDYLIKKRLVDESRLARATAEYFGLPLCSLRAFNQDLIPKEYLNIQLVKRRSGLPVFKKSGLLYMAVTDPTIEHLYEIKFLTGLGIRVLIVESSQLEETIDKLFNTMILSDIDGGDDAAMSSIEVDSYKEDVADLSSYDVDSAPIVNFVNHVLLDAIEKKASDIHFEHYESAYRVRYRLHGVLYPVNFPPLRLANYIVARIKVMSNLDITEHRIPQDGRFKLIISKKRSVDFRVSVCPTLFGEKIVLRILDTGQTLQGLDKLGMEPQQMENFANSLKRSQGLILVTGPTGSGKTVTLYTGLNVLNEPEKNISTVEDPVEIPVEGINQIHVNPKTGLTFSVALRAFLRQDPDVIMVGEIRDLETAEIAVKAAQTGHLVLSTLHTNSAPETVSRLMNMGIEPYNLANSLAIVIAQRLLRVLCDECKKEEKLSEDILVKEGFTPEQAKTAKLYTSVGCEHCTHGFKGRTGIFEVMPISKTMAQLIMNGGNAIDIVGQARKEGVRDLRESGLDLVGKGTTSLAELNRVFR